MLLILKGPGRPSLLIHSLPSLGTPGFYRPVYHLTSTGPSPLCLGAGLPVMGKTRLGHFLYASE